MSARALVRGAALAAALTGVALLGAGPAWGHASFLGASPAPGARVGQAPARIVLVFSEPLNVGLSRTALIDARTGDAVPARRVAAGGRRLALAPARPLPRGAYRIDWHTVSDDDGHALEGSFGFGVRARAATASRSIEASPLARGGWARALARALMYAALLLFCGGLLLRAFLRRDAEDSWLAPAGIPDAERPAIAARERSLLGDVGLFAAALSAVVAALEAFRAADSISIGALRDFLLSNATGAARVGIPLLCLLAVALLRRRPRAAAVAGLAALACVVLSGHANSAAPRAPALLADWTHLVAGAVWLGGAALIVMTWGPALRRDRGARMAVVRHVLPRFGRAALPAFAVVVATGTASALIELDGVDALWRTDYGRILLVKIVLVALIGAAAFGHARRLRPRLLAANPHPDARDERRHWRLLRTETLLSAAVVAAVGLLVAFPLPPRQLAAASGAREAIPACRPCPLPPAQDGELAVAEAGGSDVVGAWIGPLGVTVRLLDVRGRPAADRVSLGDINPTRCGAGCFRFATARATVRPSLVLTVSQRGRRYRVSLPSRWPSTRGRRARAILDRAERTMRVLDSVRESERVSSGPGTGATTNYRLRAPDRMDYVTDRGVRGVSIAARQWLRAPGLPWRRNDAAGGISFSTRSWFRWSPYAPTVALLRETDATADLALFDPGTPVWIRLRVDLHTGRVLRERLIAPARFSTHRWFAFNRPVRIDAPSTVGR